MSIHTILIANRGEIALRIIRACKQARIESVAVYSDADADSLHVSQADRAVHVGPPLSYKSYLNQDNIINAAKAAGADAIHPGYGFLSENAKFAKRCADEGIVFIGPSAKTIARAGDKAAARKTCQDLGVPVIPGSDGAVASAEDAADLAEEMGYPIILKAAGGGGGRGMRIVREAKDLAQAFAMASGEAKSAFGNPHLYLEKYIESPRHIEIQILGDCQGNYVHLGERECSIQLRYQKLIEEAPSSFVDEALRRKLGETAVKIARAVNYVNAGTIEFLVDKDKNFYFMEMNARVQVEHPITELVTGVDIVQAQIRIARGEALGFEQKDVVMRGWAMECRINASDPDENFMPSPGEIESVTFPEGPGIRLDTYIQDNCLVPPFYDSLIGKLIVFGKDREGAVARMRQALSQFKVTGIATTIPFYLKVVDHPDFKAGDIDTHFLERMGL